MPRLISKETVQEAISYYDQHKGFLKRIKLRKDVLSMQVMKSLASQIDQEVLTDEEVFQLAQCFYDHPTGESHESHKAFQLIFDVSGKLVIHILALFKANNVELTKSIWPALIKAIDQIDLNSKERFLLAQCFYDHSTTKAGEFYRFFEGILGRALTQNLARLHTLNDEQPLTEELFRQTNEDMIFVLDFLQKMQCSDFRASFLDRYAACCYEDTVSHVIVDLPLIASLLRGMQERPNVATRAILKKIVECPDSVALLKAVLDSDRLTESVVQKISVNSADENAALHRVFYQLQNRRAWIHLEDCNDILQLMNLSKEKLMDVEKLLVILEGYHLDFTLEWSMLYEIVSSETFPDFIRAIQYENFPRLTQEIFDATKAHPKLSITATMMLHQQSMLDDEEIIFHPVLVACLHLWCADLEPDQEVNSSFSTSSQGQLFQFIMMLYRTWRSYQMELAKDLPPAWKESAQKTDKEQATELKYQAVGYLLTALQSGSITDRLNHFNTALITHEKVLDVHRDKSAAKRYLITRNILLGIATLGVLPLVCWWNKTQWFFNYKPTKSKRMRMESQKIMSEMLAHNLFSKTSVPSKKLFFMTNQGEVEKALENGCG